MIKVQFEKGFWDAVVATIYVALIRFTVKASKIQYDIWMVYKDLKHDMSNEPILSFNVPDQFVYIAMCAIFGVATFIFIRKMRRCEPR